LPGSADFAYAEGCRCCPDQLILRTPKAVGIARINCRSALAREWGFAATHLSPGLPRSPASRLLQIRVFRRLPVFPGSMDFAYAEVCRCCPDQLISRTRKVADVARINGFCVRRRLPVLPGSMDLAYAEGCRDCGIDCRSALAREDDFDATHLSSGSPRSPASRLLQIRVRGTLPVLPGPTDFAYAEGCRCCPDQL
jgi:hypothetical protein